MKYFLASALVAIGLSGVGVGGASADKTWTSDPAPRTTARTDDSRVVYYCNRAGTRCVRAYGYRPAR